MPLFMNGKLRTSKINCEDKISKKPCLLRSQTENSVPIPGSMAAKETSKNKLKSGNRS